MSWKNLNTIIILEQAKGIWKTGHDSVKLLKWMGYFDTYYENDKFYDFMASI